MYSLGRPLILTSKFVRDLLLWQDIEIYSWWEPACMSTRPCRTHSRSLTLCSYDFCHGPDLFSYRKTRRRNRRVLEHGFLTRSTILVNSWAGGSSQNWYNVGQNKSLVRLTFSSQTSKLGPLLVRIDCLGRAFGNKAHRNCDWAGGKLLRSP